jgi:hypothetical protein
MLEKTEAIITKFRELNRDMFYESALDYKPDGAYYGHFDEIEYIYQAMYSLYLNMDTQIFFGNYKAAYSHPLEIIKELKRLREFVAGHLTDLKEINAKYGGRKIPVFFTYENYLKTAEMLDYVFDLEEIRQELEPTRIERLESELLEMKFKRLITKNYFRLFIYTIVLIGPIVFIITFWDTFREIKWFTLLLYFYPIIDSFNDRAKIKNTYRFLFSKAYRARLKSDLKDRLG